MTAYFKTGSFWKEDGRSWHGLEDQTKPIQSGMDVTDAIGLNGMDKIEVIKVPRGKSFTYNGITYNLDGTKEAKFDLKMINTPWTESNAVDLDRIVSWYNPIQNVEYAEILNPLTQKYQIASVLQVGKLGEIVIYQFDMGDFEVMNLETERHESRLTIAENRTTGEKYWGTTNTRIVCSNTFNLAVNGGLRSMPSGKDNKLVLGFEVQLEEHRLEQIGQLNRLFTKKSEKSDIVELASMLFPTPERTQWMNKIDSIEGYDMTREDAETVNAVRKYNLDDANLGRAMVRQEKHMTEFFQTNRQYVSELGNTSYANWQTVTHHFNHSDNIKSAQDRKAGNNLFGDSAKQMASAWALLNK